MMTLGKVKAIISPSANRQTAIFTSQGPAKLFQTITGLLRSQRLCLLFSVTQDIFLVAAIARTAKSMPTSSHHKSLQVQQQSLEFACIVAKLLCEAVEELSSKIGITENEYRKLGVPSHKLAKPVYVYKVLDEVGKTAMSICRWAPFIKEHLVGDDPPKNEKEERSTRVIAESLIDEQSFKKRKMLEALVQLVCFSATDEDDYYRDFLSLGELDSYIRSQNDRKEFYGFSSNNAQWSIDLFADMLGKLEKRLTSDSRWYLKKGNRILKENWKEKGVPFSSFKGRFRTALPLATDDERILMGKTYSHVFSATSEDIHFSPIINAHHFRYEDIFHDMSACALLARIVVIRVHNLLKVPPEGSVKKLIEISEGCSSSRELIQSHTVGDFEAGDFVVAQGYFGEVIEICTSDIGYRGFHVKFLDKSPLGHPSDWFAAHEILLILRQKKWLKQLAGFVSDGRMDAKVFEQIQGIPEDKINGELRKHMVQLWKSGFLQKGIIYK
jgi:hypothetical protein